MTDFAAFEALRADLVALAYRTLGDLGRAEDIAQEAWLGWSGRDHAVVVESPRAYLVTIVTRLCLNELESARARREESRSDRLPEPVDLAAGGLARAEELEQVSMAFLVVLQKLTPAERAVLLLHDVFDFDHAEIASLVGRNTAACRKLLERAREGVAEGKRMIATTREEHERLLHAFVQAASAGLAYAGPDGLDGRQVEGLGRREERGDPSVEPRARRAGTTVPRSTAPCFTPFARTYTSE